jgi:hypothetical protein
MDYSLPSALSNKLAGSLLMGQTGGLIVHNDARYLSEARAKLPPTWGLLGLGVLEADQQFKGTGELSATP